MKLSVAANFDVSIIDELAKYPVDEVFGKFPADFASGGRPSYMGTPLSWGELRQYIQRLKSKGIAFNYLLNPACTANREWTRRWQKKLSAMLDKLEAKGVTRLTVCTPYLLETIKARHPQFKIKVGLYAMVDSPRRARFWEDLGADCINLECRSINRDLDRLGAIRSAVKCDLQLIANHICIPNCPMLGYHQNSIAHASDGSGMAFVDYCFFRCSRLRLETPSLLIKAGWIRPEDIAAYERLGFENFKILERGIPSTELLKRVKAYSERRFDGNLAEILLPYGFARPPKKQRFWAFRHFFKPWQFRTRYLGRFMALAKNHGMMFGVEKNPFYIDSRAIPQDFLNGFYGRDCSVLDCGQCGYCERIAEKAVRVDEDFRAESLARYRELESVMINGDLWGV
jgi:collagenase-like PrtC family protease